ncbi:chaplin [Streptomyces sp. NPDC021080]|uniref:chaplin n=1 Tax=Streptomyces sp. NPDC021080 TaxID=3365110 RepID=UPI003788F309
MASGNNVQVPVNVPLNVCGNTVDVIAALNPAFGNSCANGPVSQGRHAAPHHSVQHDAGPARHRGPDAGHGGTDQTRGLGDLAGGLGDLAGGHSGEYGGHPGAGQGGYGGEHRGYGDSGYGDSRQAHPGHMRAGHGDSGVHQGGWSGSSSYGQAQGSPGVLSGDQAGVPVDVPVELCGNSLDVVGLLNSALGNECGHHHAPEVHRSTPHHCTPPHTPPRAVPQPPKKHTPHTPVVYTPPVKVHEQPPAPPSLAETGSEGMIANAAISAVLLAGGTLLYRRSRAASRP